MKLLFDENLSYKLCKQLSDIYKGSQHVDYLKLDGRVDWQILRYATQNGFIVTTKDSDYFDLIELFENCKVIKLNVGNITTFQVGNLLRTYYVEIETFSTNKNRNYLILP